MESTGLEENDPRARSFRYEDYNNRRIFLRSYPLQWGGEDEKSKDETVRVTKRGKAKKPLKTIILSVFHWGEERTLIFTRFKHKVTFYVLACLPVGFKPPTAMISA